MKNLVVISIILFFALMTKCKEDGVYLRGTNNITLQVPMYPSPFNKEYIIDGSNITVLLHQKFTEKDSLIAKYPLKKFNYSKYLTTADTLTKLTYENKCINDGLVYDLIIRRDSANTKEIRFSNVYHESLEEVINFINSKVKSDDKLEYDAEILKNLPKTCN
jgi:hypothetical protein